MQRKLTISILSICLVAVMVVLPLAAQTTTLDPNAGVVVVGPVDFGQGGIMVNGYNIAPASAFQPSILHQGDLVVITGNLLPDGKTIQATSFEFFAPTEEVTQEPTVEVTPEPTVEVTPEPTAEVTVEPTVEVTPEATAPVCNHPDQPVGHRLADAFGVSYDEIMGWFCQGFGFGEIARAYLLADATGDAAATYFADRQAGEGWGQIVKEAGVHPSNLAPGQVIRQGHGHNPEATEEATEELQAVNGQGNANGQGGNHGGNNGGGNGNGNNGGGNGNGNAGGNGNGNGGGNGKGNK